MGGFWTPELMEERLPSLIKPYAPSQISHSSYELCMGSEAYVTYVNAGEKTQALHLDVGGRVVIPPGQFAHLLTEEHIEIPRDALGLISIKFGLKRRGLINVSGFHVDPGFRGQLIFSVYNAGPQQIVVSRGKPVFLLWFCSLEGPTGRGYGDPGREGSRLEQAHISDDDIMNLQGDVLTPQALAARVQRVETTVATLRNVLAFIGVAIVAPISINLIATYWDKIVSVFHAAWPG